MPGAAAGVLKGKGAGVLGKALHATGIAHSDRVTVLVSLDIAAGPLPHRPTRLQAG